MSFYRDLEDIVSALKKAKDENINVNLLIGAGCSVTSGIPAAKGFVNEIKKKYSGEYRRAINKDYATCMSMLTKPERKKLITDFVNNAKINWAHLSIGQLVKCGYFKRIFTTNFDNLLLRGCALVGEFPGVYDLATSQGFRTELLFDKSILYLHGQYTGFTLCNTKDEIEAQKANIKNVFDELKKNSMWIIVGYSGENDAVLQLLSEEKVFEHRLFWVGYENEEPSDYVKESLLGEEKYAFYVRGFDADTFFVKLTQELKCFPPRLIEKPFTYLNEKLKELTEFKLNTDQLFCDEECANISTIDIIDLAIREFENNKGLMANHYLKLGLYDKVMDLVDNSNSKEQSELFKNLNNFLNIRLKNALTFVNNNKDVIAGNDIETLKDLAEAYKIIALLKNDGERLNYLVLADKTYQRLYELDYNEHLYNWAQLLIEIASCCKETSDVQTNLLKAESKYSELYDLDKENIDVILAWSELYIKIAASYNEDLKINDYINKAKEKLELAYSLDTKNKQTLIRWGNSIIQIVLLKNNDNLKDLINEANHKFEIAYEIDKNDLSVLIIWGYSLFYLVNSSINNQLKQKYITIAIEKFKIAFLLDPRNPNTIKQWQDCIMLLIKKEMFDLSYQKLYGDFLKIIKQHEDDIKCDCLDDIVSKLNGLAYSMIMKNEFYVSTQLIDGCIGIKTNEVFQYATKGLWYLRNGEIDIDKAEKEGNKYYYESIDLSKKKCDNYDTEALKQKRLYELAVFYSKRKMNYKVALDYCNEAIQMGQVGDYINVYQDCLALLTNIGYLQEAAATKINC